MNEMKKSQPNVRWLSYSSIVLAILGAVLFWWLPLGMVASVAGLTLGLVDWVAASRRSLDYRLAILGVVLCIAALALDGTIAYLGMQTVTFTR